MAEGACFPALPDHATPDHDDDYEGHDDGQAEDDRQAHRHSRAGQSEKAADRLELDAAADHLDHADADNDGPTARDREEGLQEAEVPESGPMVARCNFPGDPIYAVSSHAGDPRHAASDHDTCTHDDDDRPNHNHHQAHDNYQETDDDDDEEAYHDEDHSPSWTFAAVARLEGELENLLSRRELQCGPSRIRRN